MHENPLLPNARLKEIYALMQRCRELAHSARPAQPRLEAMIAASMLHLEAGDICLPFNISSVSTQLAAERVAESKSALETPLPSAETIAYATGAALSLKLYANQRFTLACCVAGAATNRTEQGWKQSLLYAQQARLPLVLLCADFASPRSSNTDILSWSNLSALAKKHRLPVLTVDGTDAVAVHRVMQESSLRARQGDGLAIIWNVLPALTDRSSGNDPLRKMRSYLAVRDLLPEPWPRRATTKRAGQ